MIPPRLCRCRRRPNSVICCQFKSSCRCFVWLVMALARELTETDCLTDWNWIYLHLQGGPVLIILLQVRRQIWDK